MKRLLQAAACLALLGVLVVSGPQQAYAGLVNISITADTNTGIYEVFAEITDTTPIGPPLAAGDVILGIAGYVLNVTGSGGFTVDDIANESPTNPGLSAGFSEFRSTQDLGGNTMRASAFQDTISGPGAHIIEGVGLAAGTIPGGDSWSQPVKLASGNFSGTGGQLTVSNPLISVLYGQPSGWSDSAKVEAAMANSASVPEPASCVLMALAFVGVGAFGWRRKSC